MSDRIYCQLCKCYGHHFTSKCPSYAPSELAPARGSVLARLNESVKDFDFEAWKEQDSSCLLCHAWMSLDFGCEWPHDPRALLCWSCMSEVLSELIAKIETQNVAPSHAENNL